VLRRQAGGPESAPNVSVGIEDKGNEHMARRRHGRAFPRRRRLRRGRHVATGTEVENTGSESMVTP